MNLKIIIAIIIFLFTRLSFAQDQHFASRIDSLIDAKTEKPFNGIILISQKGVSKYSKTFGYSTIATKTPLQRNDQFVIGSISKQFTAALVLQEVDKGTLKLFVPIRHYLPALTQGWADTVTVHHLLTHTHGITELDKPTSFKAGTQYAYSQIGFDLLSKIIEHTSGKSFIDLSTSLFQKCGLTATFHPDTKKYKNLVNGYTEHEDGQLKFETETFRNYVAAGSFISTVDDMISWNKSFYEGNLLSAKAKELLTTKQHGAIREHPIFGTTEYGYGITVDTKDNIVQYGQTGFSPGFVSMNFYFPQTKTSVIVFENIVYGSDDFKKAFYYHTKIVKIIRASELVKKTYP